MAKPSTWISSIAKSIFTNDGVVETTADGIYNGIDKSWFTQEEKSEAYRELLALWLRMLEGTADWNVARRMLAAKIVDLWVFYVLLTTLVILLDAEQSENILQILLDVIQPSFMLVVGFYFLKRFLPGKDQMKAGANRARELIDKVKGANSNGS